MNLILDDIVLIDTSVISTSLRGFHHRKLWSIDNRYISNINSHLSNTIDIFEKDDVVVIPEVHQEYSKFAEILLRRCSDYSWNRSTDGIPNTRRKTHKKNLKLLDTTIELTHASLDSMYDVVDTTTPFGFHALYDFLYLFSSNSQIFRNSEHKTSSMDKKSVSTDIKIVATALAHSLFSEKEVQIITNDYDIPRLLKAAKITLGKEMYHRECSQILNYLNRNPVEVYSPRRGRFFEDKQLRFPITRKDFTKIFSEKEVHYNLIDTFKTIHI